MLDRTTHPSRPYRAVAIALLGIALLPGCVSHKATSLMPTPVVYTDSTVDPFAHLSEGHLTTDIRIFFATNRTPGKNADEVTFGNRPDSALHFGSALVAMGDEDTTWEELKAHSLSSERSERFPVTLEHTETWANVQESYHPGEGSLDPGLQIFVDRINAELETAMDKEVMIFIHGAKADFADAAILTAEVDHFAGRDFVGIAYAWPSHQSILNYLIGTDVRRALDSSHGLVFLLELLAGHTNAEHINILAYSAGWKVATKALFELRNSFPELDSGELTERFRIGTVVLAAIDVEVDVFLERATAISDLADQVMITITDSDRALKSAKTFMGGDARVGSSDAEATERAFIDSHHLENIGIVDVSIGSDLRGFDISGHHYWYRHPWMSSDVLLLLRTDLPPERRGLSSTAHEPVWSLSPEYPEKAREAAMAELDGQC